MQNLMDLGELYKELRVARGIKLKDVANENLSISQLSKFENGQSMLSADRLFTAIEGINMSFAEFGHAYNNYEDREFFKLGRKIACLHSQQDIEGLKQILLSLEEKDPTLYNQLNILVVKESIYSLDKSYQIEDEEIEKLTKYLYEIEEWTEYELYLFGNTLSLLSDSDLVFLGKEFVKRDRLYHSISTHLNSAKLTLLNLISVLIERRMFYYVTYFVDILESYLSYQDMFAITCLNFFKLLLTYFDADQEMDYQVLEDYIVKVRELGNIQLAEHLEITLERLLAAAV